MQQFSLVYNNLFVFLEPVDEPRPNYDCGQLMQGSSRFIEISKYDDGGQLTTRGQLMQGSSTASRHKLAAVISWPPSPNLEIATNLKADCNCKWSIIITFMLFIRFKHYKDLFVCLAQLN